jgi:carboxypeptidase family protein/uncharacterized protein DUF4382
MEFARMKPTLWAAIAALLASSACGGPHGAVTAVPGKSVAPQTHVRHLKGAQRQRQDVFGGAPRFVLDVAMYDAPLIGATAANSEFNAGILGVDAIDANGDSWQLIANANPQVVNLLSLQQQSLDLGGGTLPAGTYPSVQLLLDPASTTVTYNGRSYPVRFNDPNHPWWDPAQTIEAVVVPLTITGGAGDSVVATLDFNVFQSANLSDGIVYLTPTVAGGIGSPAISGTVTNAAGAPVSNATVIATGGNGAVANSSFTGADGTFHIRGINPGGYTVTVLNEYTTHAGVTVSASGNDPGAAPSAYAVVGPNSQVTLPALRD